MLSRQTLSLLKASPQQALGGVYGDVFWNLLPSMAYVAGAELPCIVYVANPTDEDREYMLALTVSSAGSVITKYPVRVDEVTGFPVDANSVISLPGALVVGYSDVALTMSLYEKEENEVVDTVSTALTTAGTSGLPTLPEFPELPGLPPVGGIDLNSMLNMMILLVVVVMMMKMMTKVTK